MNFQWLKKYMPRGLYGRAALILLFPVVMLQLIVSVGFIQRHFEGVTEVMSAAVVLELSLVMEELDVGSGDVRESALALAEKLEFDLRFDATKDAITSERAFYDLSGRVVVESFVSAFPELSAIDLSDLRRVEILLNSGEGILQVGFSRKRVSASNPHQLIVIMVVTGAFMSLISYIFLRNQLRPIKRMAAAAAEYGKGRVVPYTPAGALEVRAAGTAFLEMRNRIERQTQARTMMLSAISHDLRTPLTRMRLGLSMSEDAEARPMLRDVADMEKLVNSFLDFGRDDAADAPEPTDPTELLSEIVEDCIRAGDAVTLSSIEGIAKGEIVPLRVMSLRRAIENLIGNGLRYGAHVEVSLIATDRHLRFKIEDDGPGIPADRREEAVRPFTRLDPARNQDKGTGVGLGLAIVADIARVHGGSLRLGQSDKLGGLCAELVLAR